MPLLDTAFVVAAFHLYLAVGAAITQAIENSCNRSLKSRGQKELPAWKPLPLLSFLTLWPIPVAVYGVCYLSVFFERKNKP